MEPTSEGISRLYLDEKKSLAEIGVIFGVHRNQVRRWMLKWGIPTRSISEGTSIAQKGRPLSPEHRAKNAEILKKARANITPESNRRAAEKRRGRPAHNKGRPWTDEERAKHMAVRTTLEYREAAAERQRGEKGNNWKGGATDPEDCRLQGYEWRLRRQEVYERDHWTCLDCGVHCLNSKDAQRDGKRKIQAHHIVARRDGGTDDLANLMTLCMSCHQKREWRDNRAREEAIASPNT